MSTGRTAMSENLVDFIDHCNGFTKDRRPGAWFLDEVNNASPDGIEMAFSRCLKTLTEINEEGISKEDESILIDRVFELNYRVLGRYLSRKIKKEVLEKLQKINYFVQAIICGDVRDLEEHYRLNKNL